MSIVVRKNALKGLLPVVLLLISIVIGITGATVVHTMTLENPIKTPPVKGEIEENLKNEAKEVQFKNTGEADVFLRVAYTETWKNGNTILPNNALKKDGSGSVPVATPNWVNTGNWQLDADSGWLYYYKALPVGESTDLIVDHVDFVGTGSNPSVKLDDLVDGDKYENAEYDLHFTMEVVQASDDVSVSRDAIAAMFGEDKRASIPDGWKKADVITWWGAKTWNPDDQNRSGS